MTQQPLSRVRSNAQVIVGPGSQIFDRRPDFALQSARIISNWAYCESLLKGTLANLLEAEAGPVSAIVESIKGTANYFDIIEAAAKHKLKGRELETAKFVMSRVRHDAKNRNKIAHFLWAFCDELPDAVILVDPTEHVKYLAKVQQRIRSSEPTMVAPKLNKNCCYVYKISDFNRIYLDMEKTTNAILHFNRFLLQSHGPERELEHQELDSLLSTQESR